MARPKQGYHNDAGHRVPGVTTVLGVLNKPALVGWAGKLCTETVSQIYLAYIGVVRSLFQQIADSPDHVTAIALSRDGLALDVPACPQWNDICYGKGGNDLFLCGEIDHTL